MTIDIELSPTHEEKFRQEAERLNLTLEELVRAALSDLLSAGNNDFHIAAERVLRKYMQR
jgi:hypothetical protein